MVGQWPLQSHLPPCDELQTILARCEGFADEQLEEDTAEGPHVYTCSVRVLRILVLSHDLRSRVRASADHDAHGRDVASILRLSDNSGFDGVHHLRHHSSPTEVGDLDPNLPRVGTDHIGQVLQRWRRRTHGQVKGDQYIIGLQVAMDHTVTMHVPDAFQYLASKIARRRTIALPQQGVVLVDDRSESGLRLDGREYPVRTARQTRCKHLKQPQHVRVRMCLKNLEDVHLAIRRLVINVPVVRCPTQVLQRVAVS